MIVAVWTAIRWLTAAVGGVSPTNPYTWIGPGSVGGVFAGAIAYLYREQRKDLAAKDGALSAAVERFRDDLKARDTAHADALAAVHRDVEAKDTELRSVRDDAQRRERVLADEALRRLVQSSDTLNETLQALRQSPGAPPADANLAGIAASITALGDLIREQRGA